MGLFTTGETKSVRFGSVRIDFPDLTRLGFWVLIMTEGTLIFILIYALERMLS